MTANLRGTGLDLYRRIFTSKTRAPRQSLDRGSLPTPSQYLTERGLLKGKARGEWAAIICPAHKGGAEQTPSLRVSQIDGHYCCHACGVKGGDIVALHRLISGMGFLEAVRDLGGRFYD